jgi:hypothetical protein
MNELALSNIHRKFTPALEDILTELANKKPVVWILLYKSIKF